MVFSYASGTIDSGFADGPLTSAVKDGWENVIDGVAVIVSLLITLLPWAIVAGVLLWLWRRFGPRPRSG